ncbi:alpha/beta hydrolase [Streptomyces sp. NPDC096079]|uniref:alpha/beta fold hydrolase n=1 Tax=unclassified Streptomyces TaxID=2593676 RepID=UPI003319A31A
MTVADEGSYADGGAGAGHGLYVCQDGPRDAPALLLLHGSASSARSWNAMVPLLTGSHHVIRIDLLGHGRSAKPLDGGYAVPDQARRVGEVLDGLAVAHAVVVGHSSGGVVATALAEQRPDLVRALALLDTGPRPEAFVGPPSGAITPEQWPPDDERLRILASTAVSRPGYRIPDELLQDVRDMTYESFVATARATLSYLERRALPDRLAVLGKPLLVLFGEEDRRWRPSSAAEYCAVPGARVELLPGLGHSPLLEDPQLTAARVLAFAELHAVREA